jgi:hypothetical protein
MHYVDHHAHSDLKELGMHPEALKRSRRNRNDNSVINDTLSYIDMEDESNANDDEEQISNITQGLNNGLRPFASPNFSINQSLIKRPPEMQTD